MSPGRRTFRLSVPPEARGERLDRWLHARFPDLSRSRIQRLVEGGWILVDGRPPRKAGQRLRGGEEVHIHIPPPEPTTLEPEPIPLEIVYEDEDLAVLVKPAGMVVHPAPGHATGTLVHALLHRYPDLEVGGTERPGIVHRLDQGTSGLMVVARTDAAHRALTAQMAAREVFKVYWALVHGHPPERGTVDAPIGRHPVDRKRMAVVSGGREARTHYHVLARGGEVSLLELKLETGRTHQIRVHMAHLGHPLVGDPVYGRRRDPMGLERPFLHAARLAFRHPRTGRRLVFQAPLPEDLRALLRRLGLPDPADLPTAFPTPEG